MCGEKASVGEDAFRAVIDTHILIRYLTEDEPIKAKAVDLLLQKAGRGKIRIVVPSIVLAELVCVLESFYNMKADEISELAGAILNTPGVDIQDRPILRAALKTYEDKGVDFIDAWIIEFAHFKRIKKIYTFDRKHFKKLDAEIIAPWQS